MHELAAAQELLDLILRVAAENGAASISEARLRLGAGTCLAADALTFGFEALASGTAAQGCRLSILRVPAEATCSVCGWRGEVEGPEALTCAGCGAFPLTLLDGKDLSVESITVE